MKNCEIFIRLSLPEGDYLLSCRTREKKSFEKLLEFSDQEKHSFMLENLKTVREIVMLPIILDKFSLAGAVLEYIAKFL